MAVKPFKLKRNDTSPEYPFQFDQADGTALDITGKTIRCTMKKWDPATATYASGTPKINRNSTDISITDGVAGQGHYAWNGGSGDTDTSGIYHIEFEVDLGVGKKATLPRDITDDGPAVVDITDDLDAT